MSIIIIHGRGLGFQMYNEGREFDTSNTHKTKQICKVFQSILTQLHYKIIHGVLVE